MIIRTTSQRASLALIAMLIFAANATAQTNGAVPIHWAYSAFFGTGRYEFDDGGEVSMLSFAPGKRIRDAAWHGDSSRTIGLAVQVPIALGLYNLDWQDVEGTLRFENVSTISAVPGVEFAIPVYEKVTLKPYAGLGWGTEIDGGASAWIYRLGVKSRLRFERENFDWSLVNGLTYMGYSSDTQQRDNILELLTGAEFNQPLPNKRLANKQVNLHWHIAYTSYLNSLELLAATTSLQPARLDDEWELGLAFGTGDEKLGWWKIRVARVGLAYHLGGDGRFKGVALTFSSLFDR